MLLMGLRLSEGVSLKRMAALGGHVPDEHVMGSLEELGMVSFNDGVLRATPQGRLVLNSVIAAL